MPGQLLQRATPVLADSTGRQGYAAGKISPIWADGGWHALDRLHPGRPTMSSPDLTFTVHQRPPDEPPKLSDAVLDLNPPAGPLPPTEPAGDRRDESDTFLANLAFLVRFAFGRY